MNDARHAGCVDIIGCVDMNRAANLVTEVGSLQEALLRKRTCYRVRPGETLSFFVGKGGRQSGEKPNPYFHVFLRTTEESRGTDLKVLAGSCDGGHDQEKVTLLLYVLVLEYCL